MEELAQPTSRTSSLLLSPEVESITVNVPAGGFTGTGYITSVQLSTILLGSGNTQSFVESGDVGVLTISYDGGVRPPITTSIAIPGYNDRIQGIFLATSEMSPALHLGDFTQVPSRFTLSRYADATYPNSRPFSVLAYLTFHIQFT